MYGCVLWIIISHVINGTKNKQERGRNIAMKLRVGNQTYLSTNSPNYVITFFDFKKHYKIIKILLNFLEFELGMEESSFYPKTVLFVHAYTHTHILQKAIEKPQGKESAVFFLSQLWSQS